MKKLRTAFIGMDHVHVHNLSHDFVKYDEIELIGIAPVPPCDKELVELHKKINVPEDVNFKVWDDYKELLAQDIDIAVICTNIVRHADIVEETLALGINTVVEKPMALTMEDARRMYRAYKKSSAELIINWPIAWFPAFRKAKELADSGIVGDVLRVHYRSPSTLGPYQRSDLSMTDRASLWWYKHEEGGGSICDYAGYGCVLSTWITGKAAKRVSGFKKNFFLSFSDVEDYSTFTIDFGDSMGLIEGSWSTMNNGEIATGPVVYGSEGVIVADRFNPEVKVYKELLPYKPSPAPNEVFVTEPIEDNIALNVINHLTKGEPLHELITPEFNMKAMVAFDAGIRSCESGMIENAAEPFQLK